MKKSESGVMPAFQGNTMCFRNVNLLVGWLSIYKDFL